jgi:2-polyprenyl-3-methyl-5-hydroxy-6-metoxy-1,4-benzoquinol methylase
MKKDWNKVYATATEPGPPAQVLLNNLHLLPATGSALDLACGLGANALLLASHGLQVEAWDSSAVAITKLRFFSLRQGQSVNTVTGDVGELALSGRRWDVIVVSHFLDRSLCVHLPNLLEPGGLLFYQTFTRHGSTERKPHNTDFLLAENELLRLFAGLQIRYFRDEGTTGNTLKGHRGESFLVAQRPISRLTHSPT